MNKINYKVENQVTSEITYKVGDKIKFLDKEYSGVNIYPGVIISIDGFDEENTVIGIAYLKKGYGTVEVAVKYFNKEDGVKVLPFDEDIDIKYDEVIDRFRKDRDELKKKLKNSEMEEELFKKKFYDFFKETK